MRIAIYSRGIENSQHQDFKLLLDELDKYGVEPVFYQDFFNQFYCNFKFQIPNCALLKIYNLFKMNCIQSNQIDFILIHSFFLILNDFFIKFSKYFKLFIFLIK